MACCRNSYMLIGSFLRFLAMRLRFRGRCNLKEKSFKTLVASLIYCHDFIKFVIIGNV